MFGLIPWKKRGQQVAEPTWETSGELAPWNRIRSEFDSLWDRFWNDVGGLRAWDRNGGTFGLSEWEDKENEYVFQAELPGFEPSEIDVKLSGKTMYVKAEHKEEKEEKDRSTYRFGSFQRCFTLPEGVNENAIDAQYRSGVLQIHLPKTEEAKGKRIPVTAA